MDSKTLYVQFGEFVKRERVKQGLFQIEVAKRVGIAQSYYSQVERGDRQVNMSIALDICKVLDLDFNEFLQSLNKKKARVNRPEIKESPSA